MRKEFLSYALFFPMLLVGLLVFPSGRLMCADYNWPEPIQKDWPEPVQLKPTTEALSQTEAAPAKKPSEKDISALTEEERKSEKDRLKKKIESGNFTVEDLQRFLGLDNPKGLENLLKREETFNAISSIPWYSFLTLSPAKDFLNSSDFLSAGGTLADKYRTDMEKFAGENGTDNANKQLLFVQYACKELEARLPVRGVPTNNSLESAFEDEKGMCRHYAGALNDVVNRANVEGLKSELIIAYEGNEKHTWNRITFSNGTIVDVDVTKDHGFIPLAPRLQPSKQPARVEGVEMQER